MADDADVVRELEDRGYSRVEIEYALLMRSPDDKTYDAATLYPEEVADRLEEEGDL